MLACFNNPDSLREYQQRRRIHDESVHAWRELERRLVGQAKHNPREIVVLGYDDTSVVRTPHFGHREPKGLTKSRYEMVPWMLADYGRGSREYIYTSKGRFSKGANRQLTMLHAAVRRIKEDYTHESFAARKLVLIADNASDNKNNTMYAWCSDLVRCGWFDEVEMLFGEVGHTHNGVDAIHKIHNQDLGTYTAGCIGEWVSNYRKVWHKDLPEASIMDVMYDWDQYYRDHTRAISGVAKVKSDPASVRGFKFFRNVDGEPEMKWKLDPGLDREWRGVDGQAGSNGWFFLRGSVSGRPEEVVGNALCQTEERLKQMGSDQMQSNIAKDRMDGCMEFNIECARTGVVPVERYLDDKRPFGKLGRLASIGGGRVKGLLRVFDGSSIWGDSDFDGVWGLPAGANQEHVVAASNQFHFTRDKTERKSLPLPLLRPKGTHRTVSLMYNHEANVAARRMGGGGGEKVPRKKRSRRQAGENAAKRARVSGREAGTSSDSEYEPGHSESETAEEGEWVGKFFEVPFKPVVGEFVVGTAEYDNGGKSFTGIYVGRIEGFDQAAKTITYTACTPAKGLVWDKGCVDVAWNVQGKKGQVSDHFSVIRYFASRCEDSRHKKKKNKLPDDVRRAVSEHAIDWGETQLMASDDSS